MATKKRFGDDREFEPFGPEAWAKRRQRPVADPAAPADLAKVKAARDAAAVQAEFNRILSAREIADARRTAPVAPAVSSPAPAPASRTAALAARPLSPRAAGAATRVFIGDAIGDAARDIDTGLDAANKFVYDAAAPIENYVVAPGGEFLGGLFDTDLNKPLPEIIKGKDAPEPAATSAATPAAKVNPADAAARFVDDRTRTLPRGLRRYSGSDLGAAVYEGRTVDGQRYFTNRPFENLDGKRRLNVEDTGTTGGNRILADGSRAPIYSRGSIVPPSDEINGAFEFQLDRSTIFGGPSGKTYPEFAPGDVMPAVKEDELRALSMADRERFDAAQLEAERGAQYQNAPIRAERDELLQRGSKAQAELLAGMTPAQQAKYFADQDSAINRREDNARADAAAAYQATRDAVLDARDADKTQRTSLEKRAERATNNPTAFVDTTDFNTSDAGIEKFLTEEASVPERAAISSLLGALAVDSGIEQYSQATLLRDIMLNGDGELTLPNPDAWPWQDDEKALNAAKLRTSNPEALDVLTKVAARNTGLRRGNR